MNIIPKYVMPYFTKLKTANIMITALSTNKDRKAMKWMQKMNMLKIKNQTPSQITFSRNWI